MERLLPPAAGTPLPPPPALHTTPEVDRSRVLGTRSAARRPPPSGRLPKRRCAIRPAATVRSPPGLADLLWALSMKPEFQLIY